MRAWCDLFRLACRGAWQDPRRRAPGREGVRRGRPGCRPGQARRERCVPQGAALGEVDGPSGRRSGPRCRAHPGLGERPSSPAQERLRDLRVLPLGSQRSLGGSIARTCRVSLARSGRGNRALEPRSAFTRIGLAPGGGVPGEPSPFPRVVGSIPALGARPVSRCALEGTCAARGSSRRSTG